MTLDDAARTHAGRAADAGMDPLAEPGRVTFAGDWHGEPGAAKWAIRHADRAGSSVVLHTGDFGIWPGRTGEVYLDAVESYLEHAGMILVFVDGNHEDFDQVGHHPRPERHGLACVRPRLYHAPRGTRWQWAGLRWLALGGATSLDRPALTLGVSWWPGEELTWADTTRAVDGGPADVVVAHDCSAGVDIPGLLPARFWPEAELRRAGQHRHVVREVLDAVRPTHIVHGHYHSRYTAELDLGGGLACAVTGLDRGGTQGRNVLDVDLDDLSADSAARRA